MVAIELLPTYDCSHCDETLKKNRGCNENGFMPMLIDGEWHYRCPRLPIYKNPSYYSELFRAYRHYKMGYLPRNGGIDDQPFKLMLLFQIIDSALNYCESVKNNTNTGKGK